ncbi:hypothetical protein PLEOSDRAFT_1081588 [Pleurotus ostreatus PC15]|nr:hypothetical protein PLEOSDRAFT_1081588 [Pleurotus ostreatus PC15]
MTELEEGFATVTVDALGSPGEDSLDIADEGVMSSTPPNPAPAEQPPASAPNAPAPKVAQDNQVIPTATALSRDQNFPRRDPSPHPNLQFVRAVDNMPYSYEFTNPLSGVKIIATITDVWCVHIVAGHLRSGKHLEFYKNNYSDLYYSIVKCLNQEPYLLERNCQLPMITEDGLVLRLGNHNPSAFILGLLPLNPAKGSAAKQEVMAHPIPRHSKKLKGPAPIDDPPARRPVHPEDPYSQLYDLEPSLLFQSVVSLARSNNQELQEL